MRGDLPGALSSFPGADGSWELLIDGKDLAGILQELLGFCSWVYGQSRVQFCVLQTPAFL